MTRYFIEGSHNYYYNSEGYIEFCTKTKRFVKRDNITRNNIIYCKYDIINSQNRKRIKNIPLYIFHIKYTLQKNLDNVYITFKDNDSNNLSNENINYNLIYELCQEWLPCVRLGENYMLSSNGNLYDKENKKIIIFCSDGSYCKKNGFLLHHLVWEYFNGTPIKTNYVIDHIDNNILNNSISNLQMISQNLNVKKERVLNIYKYKRLICVNNHTYQVSKSSDTLEEKNSAYYNALSMLDNDTFFEKITDHYYIQYNFSYLHWYISRLPKSMPIKETYKELKFSSFLECENYFDMLCEKYKLSKYELHSYEFYKNRGCINFKHLGERYQITLYKGLNDYNDMIIKYFLSHEKLDVIKNMNMFKSKSIELLQEIKDAKENLKNKT